MFADVTSANVVGYTTKATSEPSVSMGAMFVGIGNNAMWKLNQLTPKGIAQGDDYIQFLDNNNASVYLFATWYDPAEVGEEDGGWCNWLDDTELLNELQLTVGTAFLTNMGDGDFDYTFSGAVVEPGNDNKVTITVDGQGSPFVANPLPRKITLGDIVPAGLAQGDDYIQFLDSKAASVYLFATWYDPAEVGEDEGGWCNWLDDTELLNDVEIAPGEAFLGNINTDVTTELKFIFPAAIEK